jgi:hypothetical protein
LSGNFLAIGGGWHYGLSSIGTNFGQFISIRDLVYVGKFEKIEMLPWIERHQIPFGQALFDGDHFVIGGTNLDRHRFPSRSLF